MAWPWGVLVFVTKHAPLGFFLFALALAGCSSGAGGGGTAVAPPKEYRLALNVEKGEKFPYHMSIIGEKPEQNAQLGLTMAVDKVEGDKVTFRTTVESMSLGGNDMTALLKSAMGNFAFIQTMDKRGQVTESKVEGAPEGMSNPASGTGSAVFPEKPVKVGETWTATTNMVGHEGEGTYKLVRIENAGGKELAVIELTTSPKDFTLDGPALLKVDTATGMTQELTMSGTMTQQGNAKVKMTMTMVEAPVEPAKKEPAPAKN